MINPFRRAKARVKIVETFNKAEKYAEVGSVEGVESFLTYIEKLGQENKIDTSNYISRKEDLVRKAHATVAETYLNLALAREAFLDIENNREEKQADGTVKTIETKKTYVKFDKTGDYLIGDGIFFKRNKNLFPLFVIPSVFENLEKSNLFTGHSIVQSKYNILNDEKSGEKTIVVSEEGKSLEIAKIKTDEQKKIYFEPIINPEVKGKYLMLPNDDVSDISNVVKLEENTHTFKNRGLFLSVSKTGQLYILLPDKKTGLIGHASGSSKDNLAILNSGIMERMQENAKFGYNKDFVDIARMHISKSDLSDTKKTEFNLKLDDLVRT